MDDKWETKRYFECHVTMNGDPTMIKPIVETSKWTFSAIDGDPDLGNGVKCYATKQYNERSGLPAAIGAVSVIAEVLQKAGVNVVREKVEMVVYDRRYR